MKNLDLKESLFLVFSLIFSTTLVVVSFSYPADSSDFPRFLSSLMLLTSMMMAVNTLRSGKIKSNKNNDIGKIFNNLKIPLSVFLGTALYISSIGWLGYYYSTALFMSGGMLAAGGRKYGLIALATGLFLFLVFILFGYSLGLQLPPGSVFR